MNQTPYSHLTRHVGAMKAAAIAFSGGTDSTLLLAAVHDALGERAMAFTVVTPYMERQEIADALALAEELRVHHELIEMPLPESMERNPPDRCYLCKRALFEKILARASEAGYTKIMDGTNLDDLNDYRPGLRALRELGIESPLLECRLTKEDVRRLSAERGLRTFDKPTNACLLTRLPLGERISMEKLQRIEEAEIFLKGRGYRWVRVRMHETLARIEVAQEQLGSLLEDAETVVAALERLGFRHVTLDLCGYRLGSMNPEPD